MSKTFDYFRKIPLTVWIFIGIIFGVLTGLIFGQPLVPVTSAIGDLFLRLLKMVIVPLIFTSITSGVLGIGTSRNLGRLGLKTIAYYVTSSLIAILTGLQSDCHSDGIDSCQSDSTGHWQQHCSGINGGRQQSLLGKFE